MAMTTELSLIRFSFMTTPCQLAPIYRVAPDPNFDTGACYWYVVLALVLFWVREEEVAVKIAGFSPFVFIPLN